MTILLDVCPSKHLTNVQLARLLQHSIEVASEPVFADFVEEIGIASLFQQALKLLGSDVLLLAVEGSLLLFQ